MVSYKSKFISEKITQVYYLFLEHQFVCHYYSNFFVDNIQITDFSFDIIQIL